MMRQLSGLLARNSQILVLLALAGAASVLQEDFLTRLNLSAIAVQYSIIGLIALGQLAVMLTGGIDLAQGSLIAVSSITVAAATQTLGLPAATALALLAPALLGGISGAIAAFTRTPPFVITLGMLGAARGLALTLTNSRPIPLVNESFHDLAWARWLDVPLMFFIFLAAAGLLHAFLSQWPLGRHFYSVGGSEENSRLSGVPVAKVKIAAYSLSGLLAGVAGLLITARMGTGHPLSGSNYELESIAAVIIGGASLFGGVGRVGGIVAGVLILGTVNSSINLSGVSPYLHGTLKGAVILLAVTFSQMSWARLKVLLSPRRPVNS